MKLRSKMKKSCLPIFCVLLHLQPTHPKPVEETKDCQTNKKLLKQQWLKLKDNSPEGPIGLFLNSDFKNKKCSDFRNYLKGKPSSKYIERNGCVYLHSKVDINQFIMAYWKDASGNHKTGLSISYPELLCTIRDKFDYGVAVARGKDDTLCKPLFRMVNFTLEVENCYLDGYGDYGSYNETQLIAWPVEEVEIHGTNCS